MGLVLDIGNTNTHIGLFEKEEALYKTYSFPTNLWFSSKLNEKIEEMQKYEPAEGLALASVVPEATKVARSIFRTRTGIEPWTLTYETAPLRLKKYPDPSSLGADRIANAIAASQVYKAPAVVVSCGTAVTVDYVDEQKYFRGGTILPGISMFTRYLHEQTALLPEIKFEKYNRFYGKDTKTAILAGINKGFPAMIRTIVEGICRQFKCKEVKIVATGAYALAIKEEVGIFDVVDPNLTLAGILFAYLTREKNATLVKKKNRFYIVKNE